MKKKSGERVLGKAAILSVMVRVGVIEKVTFEQTFEGEGMSHVTLWEKCPRQKKQCKGSEVSVCLV